MTRPTSSADDAERVDRTLKLSAGIMRLIDSEPDEVVRGIAVDLVTTSLKLRHKHNSGHKVTDLQRKTMKAIGAQP